MPTTKSAYEIDPLTGEQYLLVKPTGSTNAAGRSVGEANVNIISDVKGNYPQYLYLGDTATLSAAGVMYTSGNVTQYNRFTLSLTALAATSVTVSVSLDGTTYTDVRLTDLSTGTVFATNAITAVGTYILDGKFKFLKVTLAGTGATTITYNHGVI